TVSNPSVSERPGLGVQRLPQGPTVATLTDTLPDGVRFVSADHAFTQVGNVLTFDLGTIPTDGSVVIHVAVLPIRPQTVTNLVQVTGTDFDPNPDNNTASVDDLVNPIPANRMIVTGQEGASHVKVFDSGTGQ